jgi:integrase
MDRLTDLTIRALLKKSGSRAVVLPDGTVPGLSLRIGMTGSATWSLLLRVVGEGGVKATGRKLMGSKLRVNLGSYPAVTLEGARAQANQIIDEANRGINPKAALKASATAGGLTIAELSQKFMADYVHSKQLDSASKYQMAFDTHINPEIGKKPAERLTREDCRELMNAVRIARPRAAGERGGRIGGVEAARTAMGVLRQMLTWASDESVLNRRDNPASKIQKNLPKKKTGERVLSLREARVVWNAAQAAGYAFGWHAQLMLLSACRLDEWASARRSWLDLDEALLVIPADDYKSDHVHVIPLVPQAVELLRRLPAATTGDYVLSSTGGSRPIQGVSKFFNTRLRDEIIAQTGAPLPHFTSHDLRRTVATQLAESLGDEGDKLIKRVLGHSDGSVTAIYNRYGYVREMRRALEQWANDLTASSLPSSSAALTLVTEGVTGAVSPSWRS